MRLGQLARRLDIKANKIVSFLETEHDTVITEHPNSKIPDELVDPVISNFKPNPVEEMQNALAEKEEISEDVLPEVIEEAEINIEERVVEEITTQIETVVPEVAETTTEIENTDFIDTEIEKPQADTITEEDLNIVDGVIKAPKVEFQGVKVVGKIDLPEPSIPVENPTPNTNEDEVDDSALRTLPDLGGESLFTEKTKAPRKRPVHKKKPKPTKKEISQAEIEAKEKELYLEKKKAQEIKNKVKKKSHYDDNFKVKNNPKKVKTKKAPSNKVQVKRAIKKAQEQKPKSLWGKFMYWLNDK